MLFPTCFRSLFLQRFIFVYRPMLGKNSKHESLPNIGCLSMFMFFKPNAVDIEFEE